MTPLCLGADSFRAEQGVFVMRQIKQFLRANDGATAIEYALISALIALALVTILTNLGTQLSAEFSEVSSALK
jgi:pilus assembly protein Flp/PilA